MPTTCSAYGCSNKSKKDSKINFFSFPLKNSEMLKKWIRAVRRKNFTPTIHSRLCSEHFIPNDYTNEGLLTYRAQLKPEAIPSIFCFSSKESKCQAKHRRLLRTVIKKENPEPPISTDIFPSEHLLEDQLSNRSIGIQTDVSIYEYEQKIMKLETELKNLKQQQQHHVVILMKPKT